MASVCWSEPHTTPCPPVGADTNIGADTQAEPIMVGLSKCHIAAGEEITAEMVQLAPPPPPPSLHVEWKDVPAWAKLRGLEVNRGAYDFLDAWAADARVYGGAMEMKCGNLVKRTKAVRAKKSKAECKELEALFRSINREEDMRIANEAIKDVCQSVTCKLLFVENWTRTTEGVESYRLAVAEARAMLEEAGKEHGSAMARAQADAFQARMRAIDDAEALIKRTEKNIAASNEAKRMHEAEQAKKQAAVDETAMRLANAFKYTPAQWEELVASDYDEVLKKKLFDRLANVLAATKSLADPVEWRKLYDMRETWRSRMSIAKREAKEAARRERELKSELEKPDSSPTAKLTKLTKRDKRAPTKKREKEAKERDERESVVDVERRLVEEDAALAEALAASVESVRKENELSNDREVAQMAEAQHSAMSSGRGGRGGRGGRDRNDAFILYRRTSDDGRSVVFDSRAPPQLSLPPPTPHQVMPLSALSAPSPSRGDAVSTVATALQCVVCMTKERTHLLFPCGHKCLCVDCAKPHVIKNKCPLCRNAVQGITEVFE